MITKYAIIDHVGSLESDVINRMAYNKVYRRANKDGYDKTNLFTMKKFCQMNWNPHTKTILDDNKLKAMKFAMRHQKNPEKVYFICPTLDYNTEREVQKWHDRGVKVRVFEINAHTEYDYEDFYDTHQFDIDGKASINRRLAEIWAPAFGYSFSAPITRIQRENNIENFTKRPDHDAMVESGEAHYSKPFTSNETFLEMNRCVATDAEIKKFRQYLDAYLKIVGGSIDTRIGSSFGAFIGDASALQEFLNPDYIICPECKRPTNIRNHKDQYGKEHINPVCQHCDNELDAFGFDTETYYEDSSEE